MDQRFIAILTEIGELASTFKITPTQQLEADIGIDSLKLIDIVLRVESEFGIELDEDSLGSAKSVSDLWSAIESKIATKCR